MKAIFVLKLGGALPETGSVFTMRKAIRYPARLMSGLFFEQN